MCSFKFIGYYVFEDMSLPYPYELYHHTNIVASYATFNEAVDDIPFSEYI